MNIEIQHINRSRILAVIVVLVAVAFSMRLFYLQVVQHDHYTALANQEQVKRLTIPAKRGLIYGLDGSNPVPLVMNQTVFTIFADPQMVANPEKIEKTLKRVAGGNLRNDIDELLLKKDTRYQILATEVSRDQADMIKKEGLSGIGFQETSQRVYPEGRLGSQVLGFVDYEGTGRYGVEGGLQEELSGDDGLLQSVTDISAVPLNIGDQNINQPAKDGEDVVITIDRAVQARAEQALADGLERSGADSASAIVMDPQTGRVMAMANLPDYEPAEFNKVKDAALFNNSTISLPYEQGSNVKIFTFAMGLDKGTIRPDSTYLNTDSVRIEDRVISNYVKGQTGRITFQTALNWSLNTGAVAVLQSMDSDGEITKSVRQTTYDYFYNKFRLGQPTGIELAGEVGGRIISPERVEGNAVRYSNMSFGQGMDITMIQSAAAFSALVNDGEYRQPTVIAGKIEGGEFKEAETSSPERMALKSTSSDIKKMMENGRQVYSYLDKQGYKIGGKTGTAEVAVNGRYSGEESVGTYIGYGGDDEPKYVIMVRIAADGKHMQGSGDAVPIFTELSNWMIDYLKLQPKG